MNRKIVLLAAGMTALPSVASATGIDLSFNDETAQVVVRQIVAEETSGFAEVNLRALYSDDENTLIDSIGVNVFGTTLYPELNLGAGIKGYYANSSDDDVFAAGLGLIADYEPGVLNGIGFTAEFFYCPNVFTGDDADRLYEFETKVKYQIIPRAAAYVSYSEIRADIKDKDYHTLNDGFRVGLELKF
jgi:hypothetical protein